GHERPHPGDAPGAPGRRVAARGGDRRDGHVAGHRGRMMAVLARAPGRADAGWRTWLVQNREVAAITLVLVALVVLSSGLSDRFLTPRNLNNVGTNAVSLALLATGQTFVILAGGIDLSVGSTVTITNVIAARLMEWYPDLWPLIALG